MHGAGIHALMVSVSGRFSKNRRDEALAAKPDCPPSFVSFRTTGTTRAGDTRRMRSLQVRDFLCAAALAGAVLCSACSDRPVKKSDVTAADVVAGRVKTFEHFEYPNGKFAIDFPETWRGGYTVVAHSDTTGGSRMAVEFIFKPDPAWKAEPRPLIVVRIFTRAAWEKLDARPGQGVAAKLAAKGDDVFAFSVAPANPYVAGTPANARFEEMMQSFLQDPSGLRLTPR